MTDYAPFSGNGLAILLLEMDWKEKRLSKRYGNKAKLQKAKKGFLQHTERLSGMNSQTVAFLCENGGRWDCKIGIDEGKAKCWVNVGRNAKDCGAGISKRKKISNGENREGDIVSAENTGRNRGVSYR